MQEQNLNRSFSRRIGKSLSSTQKQAIDEMLPEYTIKPHEITSCVAEIGIGMGEHFVNLARQNPNKLHIGFEPYLNGIANALLLAKKHEITNIRLWPDDMDLVFKDIPDAAIQKLYILFPDPWPKTKQKKRRIVCPERLELFAKKLISGGMLYFVSDIDDYTKSVVKLLSQSPFFELNANPDNIPHENYIKTKYHQKAESESRVARFISAVMSS